MSQTNFHQMRNLLDWISQQYTDYSVSQFSTLNPGTRENSPVLAVTTVSPKLRACAAINMSLGPMSVPLRKKQWRNFPYSLSAGDSKGRISIAERIMFTRSTNLSESDFSAPNRSSAATIMLVQIVSSPTSSIRLATAPCGCRTRSERMFVSSK